MDEADEKVIVLSWQKQEKKNNQARKDYSDSNVSVAEIMLIRLQAIWFIRLFKNQHKYI